MLPRHLCSFVVWLSLPDRCGAPRLEPHDSNAVSVSFFGSERRFAGSRSMWSCLAVSRSFAPNPEPENVVLEYRRSGMRKRCATTSPHSVVIETGNTCTRHICDRPQLVRRACYALLQDYLRQQCLQGTPVFSLQVEAVCRQLQVFIQHFRTTMYRPQAGRHN